MEQLPLIDPSGNSLPSPVFRPRPGWGGQLKSWMHDNLYLAIFRILVVTGLVLIGGAFIHSWDVAHRPTPSTLPIISASYTRTATHGQGMTDLARAALGQYLTEHPQRLDAAQFLFSIDTLARFAGWRPLALGEQISFQSDTIADILTLANALTPRQHTAWAHLLKR